ncbi:hypothetical protein DCC85_12500 [Paenibacillus sp. CAA11]|uniref:hypothetical protein n=1 Tax=Paenibacillus sp. CAA11 TaxID=1532905 RepID=UPI000D37E8D4|nr:hypothetical protein [Paenibacillus sp. CAA11]AWB44957.1 hypothetical protein DCC85_12500 [Paenibacillus sp. CAA11]
MRVAGNSTAPTRATSSLPKLDLTSETSEKPQLRMGDFNRELKHDRVEISAEGRQLAAGAIESHPAKYFGTSEINQSLTQVLQGQSEQVTDAVYSMIQSNFMPTETLSEDQRSGLIELGLSQAKYIADQYMSGSQAEEFLNTINTIATIAKSRSVDPATGQVDFMTPQERPVGAPKDYISPSELMKHADPAEYKKFQEDIASGGNGLEVLLDFTKQIPKNPKWVKEYRAEANQRDALFQSNRPQNLFSGVDTSSQAAYKESVQNLMNQLSFNDELYKQNMQSFYKVLGMN